MESKDIKWLLWEKHDGNSKSIAFVEDCIRLQKGEPLAYVVGFIPFLGLTIDLSTKPLIPRPETEYWVEQCTKATQADESQPRPLRVLDLGAGSGCIGAAILKHLPYSCVDFVELEAQHFESIQKTMVKNGIDTNRVRYISSDLFTDVTDHYDLIVSNPPYIDPALDRTEPSVKDFEPHTALYGGTDGMDYITEIITTAPKHLTPTGQLYIEHEPEQSKAIQALALQTFDHIETKQDQYQVERYSILSKKT